MASKSEVLTLHKYFLNADRMRFHFESLLKKIEMPKEMGGAVEHCIYMALWYGSLRVVIEGWSSLQLSDSKVAPLVDVDKIGKLNGVRNDVFHYQREYVPGRTLKALQEDGFVEWVRAIHSAIGDALLKLMESK